MAPLFGRTVWMTGGRKLLPRLNSISICSFLSLLFAASRAVYLVCKRPAVTVLLETRTAILKSCQRCLCKRGSVQVFVGVVCFQVCGCANSTIASVPCHAIHHCACFAQGLLCAYVVQFYFAQLCCHLARALCNKCLFVMHFTTRREL